MTQTGNKKYKFDCGCSFDIIDDKENKFGFSPNIKFDIRNINLDCSAVWKMLGQGLTKGVFQLESPLGKQWCKKLKPKCLEHLTALGALLRPGCIGGDTSILLQLPNRHGRVLGGKKSTIRQVYEKFTRNHEKYKKDIVSLDEETYLLYGNRIVAVTYSGEQEVFKVNVQIRKRYCKNDTFYNLECTPDHKLMVYGKGWTELKDIESGDRIAVVNTRKYRKTIKNARGEKSFRDICFYNYEYKCIFCDWKDGSLDVNHLDGNRKSNNDYKNLCFLCPNHHRMFSEGKINKEQVIAARKQYELPNSKHVQWAEYKGKVSCGIKDTYDITVEEPNHNFIAGNFIVHNCLRAEDEQGISMTEHYCRRKNLEEDVTYFHPCLEPILKSTYGVLTYQEQAMEIARVVAGFSLRDADVLRKAIGKKLPEEMAKVKVMFIEGAKKTGIVTEKEAAEIFGWIEKSQRYSFNKSHSACYGKIGYWTAYEKAHFPVSFFTKWLKFAKEKSKPLVEISELVEEAKIMDIEVCVPDFSKTQTEFYNDGKKVYFGLGSVKGVGEASISKLRHTIYDAQEQLNKSAEKFSWYEFLSICSDDINKTVVERLIQVGAMRCFGLSRSMMLHQYRRWNELTGGKNGEKAFIKKRKYKNLIEALHAVRPLRKYGGGTFTTRRQTIVDGIISSIEKPSSNMDDSPNWIASVEQQYLGIPITFAKIDSCDTSEVNCTCKEYLSGRKGYLLLGVEVKTIREFVVKKGKQAGKKMAFLTISDGTCSLNDVCVFADVYEEYGHLLFDGATVLIQGERDKKKDSLIVKKVFQI